MDPDLGGVVSFVDARGVSCSLRIVDSYQHLGGITTVRCGLLRICFMTWDHFKAFGAMLEHLEPSGQKSTNHNGTRWALKDLSHDLGSF